MLVLIEDVLGLAILAFVLVQQLRRRRLRRFPYIGAFLAAIGTAALVILVVKHVVSPTETMLLLLSLAVTAALGVARGLVMHLWRDLDGSVMRQGGRLTVVLWLVAIGQHLAVDLLLPPGVGIATLSLFFGVSLVSQVVTLDLRSGGVAGPDRDRGLMGRA